MVWNCLSYKETICNSGLVYSGGTCGFYTSMLSISPHNMGTLSSLTAISRIAASVVSTSIFNTLTATVRLKIQLVQWISKY